MNFKGFLSLCFVIVVFKSVYTINIDAYEGNECSTNDNEPGICKKLSMCMTYYQGMKKKYEGHLSSYLVMCKINSNDFNDLVICCKNEIEPYNAINFDVVTESIVTPEIVVEKVEVIQNKTVSGIQVVLSKSELACQEYTNINMAQELPICLGKNIINGVKANRNEFPHMVAIGYNTEGVSGYDFLCGGTLISEKYVLSAAHCVSKRNQVPQIARLGKTSIDYKDCNDAVDIGIDFDYKTQVHADYDSRTKHHDIALLKLNESVKPYFGRFIKPACLYNGIDRLYDVVVSGWGKTEGDSTSRSNWLLKVKLNETKLEDCKALYSKIKMNILDSQICAANYEGGDACQGDSGGPMQIKSKTDNDTYYVAGVVSFGAFCGSLLPGIYVRVSSYIDWIENIAWPN